MPKNKKKFIDKKNSVTFHLVHRSQHDPLIVDETAPQHVLVPQPEKKSRLEEQRKFGIYYDDDYDYLQHLRNRNDPVNHWEQTNQTSKSKLKLPSSVFASEVEEDVGLLNKAAPQGLRLDLDPDIVAAMDEDFDFDNPDNVLEDDFVQMADGVASDFDENEEYGNNEEYEDINDDLRSDQNWSSGEEAERYDEIRSLENEDMKSTKSKFTDYSMSSSVIRRNEQLTILDDKFEHMFSSYDENEIGPLDCDEIEGEVDIESDLLKHCADDFEKERAKEKFSLDHTAFLNYIESDDSENNEDLEEIEVKPKAQWDCESILSTHSNIYNHPKLIEEPPKVSKIKLDKRGVPVIGQRLTAKALAQLGDCKPSTGPGSLASAISTLSIRPKNETPEERKQRKNALKQHRQERRIERKMNTIAFKEEKKKMEKVIINNKVNQQISIA